MENFVNEGLGKMVIANQAMDFSKKEITVSEYKETIKKEGWEVLSENGYVYTYLNEAQKQMIVCHLHSDHSFNTVELFTEA